MAEGEEVLGTLTQIASARSVSLCQVPLFAPRSHYLPSLHFLLGQMKSLNGTVGPRARVAGSCLTGFLVLQEHVESLSGKYR